MRSAGHLRNPAPPSHRTESPPPSGPENLSVDLLGNPTRRRGLWGAWLRLVMPPTSPDTWRGPSARERLRRARLLSVFLFCGFVIALALVPQVLFPIFQPSFLGIITGAFTLLALSAWLNRRGQVAVAASLLITGVVFAVAFNQFSYPGGLPLSGRTAFDLFVIPILLAGVLLPRRVSFACWGACSAFIILDLQFGPKAPDLTQFIAQQGIYTAAGTPIVLLLAVAAVAWVASGSVRQALVEADRSRELEQAYRFIAEQKRQLEDAVTILQQAHAQAANGDLNVRAPISDHALVPLAMSLNLMLGRLSEARETEMAMGGLEHRLQRLEQAATLLAQGHLRQPIQVSDLGRLTVLGQRLEQVRAGALAALQHGAELAERSDKAFQEYRRAVRQLLGAVSPSVGEQGLSAVAQAEQQAAQSLDQSRRYAGQVMR